MKTYNQCGDIVSLVKIIINEYHLQHCRTLYYQYFPFFSSRGFRGKRSLQNIINISTYREVLIKNIFASTLTECSNTNNKKNYNCTYYYRVIKSHLRHENHPRLTHTNDHSIFV